jgi:NodT family efflux transporter outer membrane factor (OMF) lipoprotein
MATRLSACLSAFTALLRRGRVALAAACLAVLGATAPLAGHAADLPSVPALAPAPAPAQWQTHLPHGGQLTSLAAWWQQFDDPALPALVAAAQALSPDLADAASRIAQAEAARVAAAVAGLQLNGGASSGRSRQSLGTPASTTASASLQAGWELDLFGGLRAARLASDARADAAQADWHAARVSLAAEVADQLLALRACEQLAQVADDEQRSRAESARLTGLAQRAGFDSPANAALADASAAQAALGARSRQVQCSQLLQGLVALTGLAPDALRSQLAPRSARLPQPAQLAVVAVPAQALAQRPDLVSSARALEAAAADVDDRRAAERPRVALNGSLGLGMLRTAGKASNGSIWSIGPLEVTLPIFDGGARRASTAAAQAAYDSARARYQASLRAAVREVEDALLRLEDGGRRRAQAGAAVAGFASALAATEQRQRAGLASRLELEDLRRSLLQARIQQTDTEREQVAAWIALYRALGGGWTPADPPPGATGG